MNATKSKSARAVLASRARVHRRSSSLGVRSIAAVAVLLAAVAGESSHAGAAIVPGTYLVKDEMTVRLNPGGFVIGGLRKGDHFRWISGQSAPSKPDASGHRTEGAHLYVRALGKVQHCGWIINDSSKRGTHADGVGNCTNGFRGTGIDSRRELVESGIADLVNDYRYGKAIDAVDHGCPIRLSGPTALYRNASAEADDIKGSVSPRSDHPTEHPVFFWRYRVAKTNIILGSNANKEWGFIRIKPGQESKLLNTIDEPGDGKCPNSRSSAAWLVNV